MAPRHGKTDHEQPYHHGDLRAALLRAAEAGLQESGIEGFSLRAVAKRAGVSHAAPAHHFGDVRGLLTALAAEGFRRFVDTQKAAMAEAGPDPREQLAAAGLGYVRFAFANPALFRLIFSSDRPDYADPELAAAAEAGFSMLAGQVSDVIGRDALHDDDGRSRVAAAWAVAHGLADLLSSGRLKIVGPPGHAQTEEMIRRIMAAAIR